ncbi:MAG: hypothetical protein ABSG62_15565 [Terracidiphilus sp.]|jgi:hypothetical protein
MSFKDKAGVGSGVSGACGVSKFAGEPGRKAEPDGPRTPAEGEGPEPISDPLLDEALRDFRLSVHAWSEAVQNRPRTLAHEVRHRSWRLAAGWALGCALVVGSVGGGLYERHHRQEMARMAAAQRAAEQQRQVREQQAAREQDEDLLAKVDSDVSREVPSAMEPLAQLMAEDESK